MINKQNFNFSAIKMKIKQYKVSFAYQINDD